ncbi:MAG: DUF6356 family protein [Paracoccaceae bacterium]|nr:DUF6356 family protein [Paracoccaceae bacterium]
MPSDITTNPVKALFVDHPASVDETYFQHMGVALRFAFWLGLAAMAALVHAMIPGACEKTASRIIRRLHDRMSNRG